MCVVSKPTKILNESRFVVCEGKVITGSEYKRGETLINKTLDESSEEFKYAQNVVNEINWEPDPVWTLDICKTGTFHSVLEIGSFSCAGLYGCNLSVIVDKISKYCIGEYGFSN